MTLHRIRMKKSSAEFRLLEHVELPDNEKERQRILTTIVVMRHSLAIEQDFAANFLLEQLKGIALKDDPLIQYLTIKTELKSLGTRSADGSLTLRNAERVATQLKLSIVQSFTSFVGV